MSWAPLLALCCSAYALKLGGALAGGRVRARLGSTLPLALVAVPVLAALVVVQTVSTGDRLVLDARVPAVVVAGVLVWRRAPFAVVAVAAAATAALLRLAG
jgi:hypothetical protein